MQFHLRHVSWITLSAALAATALASPTQRTGDEQKGVEPVLPYMEDVKTPPSTPPPGVAQVPARALPGAWAPGAQSSVKPDRSQAPYGIARLSAEDREAVHFDAPGDGALWAAGGSFKARFDGTGATYIPFLGSTAPRSYPLALQLAGVTLGGQDVPFDAGVAPTHSGAVVAFDRGTLIEQYMVFSASIEQRFVFTDLPGPGDLAVQIDVTTDLAFAQGAGGFEFMGELGGVLYGEAFALDASGARLPIESRWDAGAIELRVPAEFVAGAVFPLTIDPVIRTFAIDTSAGSDFHADTAYDDTTNRYLVIWERAASAADHDVYAKLYTADGLEVAGSGAYIDFTVDDWREPKVANNQIADRFLVVATEGAAGARVISGRTRDAGSNAMGSQFQISGPESGDKVHPDVGGDPSPFAPTYYCVVWERVFIAGTDHDVHARLVRADGTLLGPSTILIDNSGGTLDAAPSVSNSNGLPVSTWQDWNVVWMRLDTTNGVWNIYGAQVHWDGTITYGTFPIETSTFFNDMFPKVSPPVDAGYGPRQYLVVYERDDGPPNFNKDIYVSAMEEDVLIDRDNLSGLEGTSSTIDEFTPSVDTDGLVYGVAYAERFAGIDIDVYAATIYICGHDLYLLEGHQNLAFSSTTEVLPEIASRYSGGELHTEMMVVWEDSANSGDIEGGIYATPGTLGAIYCNPAVPNSSGLTGLIEALGSTSVSAGDLCLLAHHLPDGQFGYFLVGAGAGVFMPPASMGFFCLLGGPIGRYSQGYNIIQGPMGSIPVNNLLPINPPTTFLPGQTWNFQCWYRDIGNTSNFTDAVTLTFVP